MLYEFGFLKNLTKIIEKHMCWSLEVTRLQSETLSKNMFKHRFFTANFVKILGTSTLWNTMVEAEFPVQK